MLTFQNPIMLLFSCSVLSNSLWPHGLQHARLPCPSLSPEVCSHSCPLSLFSSVQLLSHVWLFATPRTAACQASLSITSSQSLLNSCPLSRWCHSTITSSVVPFSSCLQPFPASGSFQMNQFLASGGQSIRVSASAPVLPMNIQDWFTLGLTALISLKSKGLSRVFSSTTVWKHQFFSTQPSLWSNSHIHTWLLEKWQPGLDRPLLAK